MLLEKMQELAGEMKFEEAQKIKEKYLLIENYRAKSEVVSSVLHNIDVFPSKRTIQIRRSSTICILRMVPSIRHSLLSIRRS